jgi:hypothetical protein
MGGPYAELIRRHQARLFAFLRAGTSSEQAAAHLFAETFRLMAQMRVDLDPEVDHDVMVYRHALRVHGRFDVPAPDPRCELSRAFDAINDAEDRLAFVLLETSGIGIAGAAEALRKPEPRLKEALAQALVTMTGDTLEPAAEGAVTHVMVAMAAFGWLESDERAVVEADPTAAPRRAAMDRVLARVRELLPPCDPPEALVARAEAAVETGLREAPEAWATPSPRRTGRFAAIAIAGVVLLGGGGFAALQLRGMDEAATVVEEAESEMATEPAPAPPRTESLEPPPAIEVAAQGPPARTDPRLARATAHARKHRCKKAAKLFAKLVEDSPATLGTAAVALAPCRGWLQKQRGDTKLTHLARLLGLPPAVAGQGHTKRRR